MQYREDIDGLLNCLVSFGNKDIGQHLLLWSMMMVDIEGGRVANVYGVTIFNLDGLILN